MSFNGSLCLLFFFFKQKTAYEMRISDWSSDVCYSDLQVIRDFVRSLMDEATGKSRLIEPPKHVNADLLAVYPMGDPHFGMYAWKADRKSVVSGKSVSVRVDIGGRRIIKKKIQSNTTMNTHTYKNKNHYTTLKTH